MWVNKSLKWTYIELLSHQINQAPKFRFFMNLFGSTALFHVIKSQLFNFFMPLRLNTQFLHKYLFSLSNSFLTFLIDAHFVHIFNFSVLYTLANLFTFSNVYLCVF